MTGKLLTTLRCSKEALRLSREHRAATELHQTAQTTPGSVTIEQVRTQEATLNAATLALLECRRQKGKRR